MKQSAVQEAAQWEEEQLSQDGQGDPLEKLVEMSQQMRELDARQARIENYLINLVPSAKKAETQFATVVLAGKELRDEIEKHRNSLTSSLSGYKEQVAGTAEEIKGEFEHQLGILQLFFDRVLELSEKNERMVERCQDMVAMSSAVYHKGSAGVLEISEKTQAHLKATAEVHRKEMGTQAQDFREVYRRLSRLIVVGTAVILLVAFAAGAAAGALWFVTRQPQTEERRR
ncbi:MAG TPA: hypothetical protein VN256_06095 [Pyrinomonadaceae bacterium]|nr:hypothetical protein [Pyrinomonadaceae bacterium]